MFKSILKWGLIVISSGLVRDHPLGAPAPVKVVYSLSNKHVLPGLKELTIELLYGGLQLFQYQLAWLEHHQ